MSLRVLAALDGLGGLAPRLAGHAAGQPPEGPWTLISRLPGRADITPGDPAGYARQLGAALARIHATPRPGLAGFPSVYTRPGGGAAALSGPAANLVASHAEALASAPAVLTHCDFWSGNTLWQEGTAYGRRGLVRRGPGPAPLRPGLVPSGPLPALRRDHRRHLLAAYQAAASPAAAADPRPGDLWAVGRSHRDVESWVLNYSSLGRSDLTAPVLRERHAAWTRHLLRRGGDAGGDATSELGSLGGRGQQPGELRGERGDRVAQAMAVRSGLEQRTGSARDHPVGEGQSANTSATSRGVAPCAPTPGARYRRVWGRAGPAGARCGSGQ